MFYGRYEHNIDAKGRMTVPSNFRDQTPEDVVYVTKGLDGNLMAYPKPAFDLIADSLNRNSMTDPNLRAFRREILGNTAELTYDTVGRVLIPAFLRKFARIDSDVVIIGVGDSFEIWSPSSLSEEESPEADPKANSDRWAAFNISTRGDNGSGTRG